MAAPGTASRYAEIHLGGTDPNDTLDTARLGLRIGTTLIDPDGDPGSNKWLLTEYEDWVPFGASSGDGFPLTANVSAGGFQINNLGDGSVATDAANLKNINDALDAFEVLEVGADGETTTYSGATNIGPSVEGPLAASAVLSAVHTYHDISVVAISQTFSLPAAAAIDDVHILQDVGNNWSTFNITVDVQGGGTIQNGPLGAPASVVLASSGQTRTFRKIGATAWALSQ